MLETCWEILMEIMTWNKKKLLTSKTGSHPDSGWRKERDDAVAAHAV